MEAITFGKKIAMLRKEKKLSQTELAKLLDTSISVISRYERDEMTPSIDVAKRLATTLDTTVGYLLGETDDDDLFKHPDMLKRFRVLSNLDDESRSYIVRALDAMLRDAKTQQAYNIAS